VNRDIIFPFFSRERFRHFSTFGFQCRKMSMSIFFFKFECRVDVDVDRHSTFSTFSTFFSNSAHNDSFLDIVNHLALKNGKTRVEYKGKGMTHKDAAAVRNINLNFLIIFILIIINYI